MEMGSNGANRGDSSPIISAEEKVRILGELIGGYQLTDDDGILTEKELRPFCMVNFIGKSIHYSSPCREKGKDPIWTVSTGSLFLLEVSPTTILSDRLEISIWTKRKLDALQRAVVAADTFFLGRATMDGPELLSNCEEQRVELQLKDRHGRNKPAESTLAVRFRLATPSDIRLLNTLRDQGISPSTNPPGTKQTFENSIDLQNPVKDLILKEGNNLPVAPLTTEAEETKLVVENLVDSFSLAFKTKSKYDQNTGLRRIRVKPGPDPKRVSETKFLSPLELSLETKMPSVNWIEAGSGELGTLHLEILSCHDLPNLDVGEAVGNLSDCFVCAVFEDAMVQTAVIDDELSPHWMPWTQRAFRFRIAHPMSTLYLGVLDYDFGPGSHEPIGRVAVNLTNLRHNYEYTLKYNLYSNSDLTDRERNGSITIRLRIEYSDEKAALLASLQPRPQFHVNTRRSKTFWVVRYTVFGEFDQEEKFSWPVTKSYIFEILEYWRNLKFYIGECFWSLVFWRGQVEIFNARLPVHSALLFASGCILVETPTLIVSFYLLFIAWFFLATMNHRLENPSPWKMCTSFLDYLEILATNQAPRHVKDRVLPSEYREISQEYENTLKNWREEYEDELDSRYAMEEKLMSIGDENIHTEIANQLIPVDLLERLGRYQGILGRLCIKLRVVKSVITWEDSITSFWITAACLSVGLITLAFPWGFLLHFTGRVVVWGMLGPHMRFVDIYLNSTSKDEPAKLEYFRKLSRDARIRREEAIKLKDMKCLAFGDYVTLVPGFNLPRHYDRPLHESSANYFAPRDSSKVTRALSRIPGQQLYGSMIPQTKAGFIARQGEIGETKARLRLLEEQVNRLQLIQNRVSSCQVGNRLDDDLPEEVGIEISVFEPNPVFTEIIEPEEGPKRDPKPLDYSVKLSLSQTGFKIASDEEEELLTYYCSRLRVNDDLRDEDEVALKRKIQDKIHSYCDDDYRKASFPISYSSNCNKVESKWSELSSVDDHSQDQEDDSAENDFPTPLQIHPYPQQVESHSYSHAHKNASQITAKYNHGKYDDTECAPFFITPCQRKEDSVADASAIRSSALDSLESHLQPANDLSTSTGSDGTADSQNSSEKQQSQQSCIETPSSNTLFKTTERKAMNWEEGHEIIAMGRLRAVGNNNQEENRDDWPEQGLSVPHTDSSAEDIQVAL